MIQKHEVSKFFCPKSTHGRSFRSWFYCVAEWACLQHVLIEVITFSKNVQVSPPLLELRGRHVVVPQVKALRKTSPSDFSFNIKTSPVRSCEFLVTSCSSGSWVLPYWRYLSPSWWCNWRRSRRNQGCKVSVISSLITPFLRRFLACC